MKNLNRFLNAHLECMEHGLRLCDLDATVTATPSPERKDPTLPYIFSDDATPPAAEQLARISFLFIDEAALRFGTDYLRDLPNLRDLKLYVPEGSLDLGFLKTLPELQVLQIECREVTDQRSLSGLSRLTHIILDYRNPPVLPFETCPQLEYVYFQEAGFGQVRKFLEVHPDCRVDFTDDEYGVRFEAGLSLGTPLRYYSRVEDDLLEVYVYPLEEAPLLSEELHPEEQQEFLRCAAPICEEIVAEHKRSENCVLWQDQTNIWDGFKFTYQFQWLTTHSLRKELEAAPGELRELLANGFNSDKIEWWLLKYKSLKDQLFWKQSSEENVERDKDCPFHYRHSAESSFYEAFRKLEIVIDLFRRRTDWLVLQHELRPLKRQELAGWYAIHEKNLRRELLDPLRELKEDEAAKTLTLILEGYHLELSLPWKDFWFGLEVRRLVKRYFSN